MLQAAEEFLSYRELYRTYSSHYNGANIEVLNLYLQLCKGSLKVGIVEILERKQGVIRVEVIQWF